MTQAGMERSAMTVLRFAVITLHGKKEHSIPAFVF